MQALNIPQLLYPHQALPEVEHNPPACMNELG